MITELALTHPCDETIYWSAGAYRNRRGRSIRQCPGCREVLGSPFVRAEEAARRPITGRGLQRPGRVSARSRPGPFVGLLATSSTALAETSGGSARHRASP